MYVNLAKTIANDIPVINNVFKNVYFIPTHEFPVLLRCCVLQYDRQAREHYSTLGLTIVSEVRTIL